MDRRLIHNFSRSSIVWKAIILLIVLSCWIQGCRGQHTAEEYLVLGNSALSQDDYAKATGLYEHGIIAFEMEETGWTELSSATSLSTIVSLETNLATAYSAIEGKHSKVLEHYERAIQAYLDRSKDGKDSTNDHDEKAMKDVESIVSQTAFFYGMELQETDAPKAIELYGQAVVLDPELWAAWANLGELCCR